MAIRRRRAARKPRRKARKGGARRVPRGIGTLFNTNQMAVIKETVPYGTISGNNPYAFQFSLNQFVRASQLAPNFKWYKAKLVEWTIEPLFNTFTDDGTPQSIPYLYMAMNRTQDAQGLILEDLQAMGCKPQKLTTKKVVKYRPNWCSPGLISAFTDTSAYVRDITQNGLKPQYGYLACPVTASAQPANNPPYIADPAIMNVTEAPLSLALDEPVKVNTNCVVYNGHRIWLDQVLAGAVPVARVTATVHWEFKDPYCSYAPVNPTILSPALASA